MEGHPFISVYYAAAVHGSVFGGVPHLEVLASYDSTSDIPAELLDAKFEYKYDISAFFDMFEFLNVSKLAKRIGINPSLMRHYKRGDTYISDAQANKIESGIHEIAHELLRVTL